LFRRGRQSFCMAEDQAIAASELRAGRLYLRRKDKQLLRLVCVDEDTGHSYFKRVSAKWSSTPRLCEALFTRTAIQMLVSDALQPQEECVRPAFMLQTDQQIRENEEDKERQRRKDAKRSAKRAKKDVERPHLENPGQERIDKRDSEYALIEPLVTESAICATFNPQTSRPIIAARAAQVGRSMQLLERLIHRFAWFGLVRNALLRLNENKGPTRTPRKVRGPHKLGRRNAFVVAGRRVRTMQGVNVTSKDVRKFDAALKKWQIGQDLTLEDTYEQMCREMYIGVTRLSSGERIERRVNRRHIPTIEQFKYWYEVLWTTKHAARKAGPKDAASLGSNQVGDISIARNVADVFDIDATEFNRELIASFIDNGKTVNIGKAEVVLVFDRRSRKVVGWYVYAGNENWEQGYRLALFRALTREAKLRRLAYLGIEQLDDYPLWLENPKPLYVYSDNGPNGSRPARLALDRLGCASLLAPPDTPHWKPTVEGGLGNFQFKHARLSGGYARTRRARDKDARRLAKQMADSTLFQFEQKLVLQIIEYNAALNMQHMLSADMLGVNGSADEIFKWGTQKLGGLKNRTMDTATVYLALLEHKPGARLTKDGIRHNSAHYYCDPLRSLYEMGERRVDFIAHPRHEDEVFWISPDGVLTQLTMDERDQERIGKRSVVDQKMLGVHQRMQVIEHRKKGKSSAISERQQGSLKRHDRPRQQRSAPTKHQDEYRAIQAELDTATDTEDRTATYFEEATAANASTTDRLSAGVVKPPTAAPLALLAAPLFKLAPATSTSLIQPPRTLPASLHKPGLPERLTSADRWEEEDE
jgi:hypothetical protein